MTFKRLLVTCAAVFVLLLLLGIRLEDLPPDERKSASAVWAILLGFVGLAVCRFITRRVLVRALPASELEAYRAAEAKVRPWFDLFISIVIAGILFSQW